MNLLQVFINSLIQYLSKLNGKSTKLIKFVETGQEYDFSFPTSLKIWKNQIEGFTYNEIDTFQDNIMFYSLGRIPDKFDEVENSLKHESLNWIFHIESVKLVNNRCYLNLSRAHAFETCLMKIDETYGKCEKDELDTVNIEVENQGDSSVTQHRVITIANVISNLIEFSKFIQVKDPSIAKYKVFITSKSNPKKNEESRNDRQLIICGPVLDTKDNKVSSKTAQDLIQLRMNDMHLIAIHKYGIRVKDDESFNKLVQILGENATKLDMLEVRHSSALKLSSDPKKAFILYNSARLETLIEKFHQKQNEGYYGKLPNLEDIDIKLLKEEEEWELLKLILTFPDVIEKAIHELPQSNISIHNIHKFLNMFVSIFSIYYRRVRLLTDNRAQMMAALYAKFHFILLVQRIFNQTLKIFEIKPVAFM